MTLLTQTLGFFTLLALLFAAFVVVLRSTQAQSQNQTDSLSDALKAKEEFEQKAQALIDELTLLKQEMAVKNQMLEGLRGQYEELEKDYERQRQILEKTAQMTIEQPAANPILRVNEQTANPGQITTDSGSPFIKII